MFKSILEIIVLIMLISFKEVKLIGINWYDSFYWVDYDMI